MAGAPSIQGTAWTLPWLTLGVGICAKKAWAGDVGVERAQTVRVYWPHGEVAQAIGVLNEDQSAPSGWYLCWTKVVEAALLFCD